MSTPTVPARPARSNGVPPTAAENVPQVPPRPARKLDPSPIRDVRSPLNVHPSAVTSIPKPSEPSTEAPPRPPSVTLPSIGQEGSEYATYDLLPPEVPNVNNVASAELGTPEQTRNVSEEMPLHAPKASLPQSTAKSRIETVTATDSTQAAAAGIGKAKPDDDVHKTPADSTTSLEQTVSKTEDLKPVPSNGSSTLRTKPSFNRPPSGASHGSRPASIYEDIHEQGIPHIGLYTPLNPNAGDVQAPPGPTQSQHAPGVGFFNDGSPRAHQRKRSGRHEFGPPGSYGLHSHSLEPHDQFEREWYAKNRDKAAMEEYNLYGRPKPETALSSAELNRIVTQTDAGTGSSPNMIGTPGEDIGYSASDAYAARISPKVSPAPGQRKKRNSSSGSHPAAPSPLGRMTSYPFPKAQEAVEDDDVDVIHIDPAEYNSNKVTGGGPADGAVDLGQYAGNTANEGGWFVERGGGTPILASDEVLKRHESASMQPAINPEHHFDSYDEYAQYDNSRRSSMRVPSRPSSRPGSVHEVYQGGNIHRFISHEDIHHGSNSHTALEEIEEYEPLIPEGEDDSPKPKRKEVKRRPGIEHHHFPSRDIWEDTPSSLYYETTVETPDLAPDQQTAPPPSNSSKDVEASEHEQIPNALSDETTPVKPHYATRAVDNRPGAQRFPSKDIWEDTPTSLQYHTTVGGPQMDDTKSPPDDRPTTSAIPGSQDDSEARATTGFTQNIRPSVPTRPQRRSKLAEEMKPGDEAGQQQEQSRDLSEDKPPSPEKTKAPPIPERPKPTVPVRPARSSKPEQTDGAGAELAKTTSREIQPSADTARSPPVPKAKPVVPARPGGEKIAALKSGFMSDLNNRLKLGPTGPPPKSKEIEPEVANEAPKEPLADARKGRARGPPRRKPAVSPSTAVEQKAAIFTISTPLTVWSIDEQDKLQVPSTSGGLPVADDLPALEKAMTQNAVVNTEDPAAAVDLPALEKVASDTVVENAEERAPPTTDLPKLEKVLSDNTVANTEEPALVEPMSPERSLSPPESGFPDIPPSIEEQKSIQARLEASLADVGAAPPPEELGKGVSFATEVEDATETTVVDEVVAGETVKEEQEEVVAS